MKRGIKMLSEIVSFLLGMVAAVFILAFAKAGKDN